MTRVQQQKQKFQENEQKALKYLSELEYKGLILELGCQFLEALYGECTHHYYTFSKDQNYWKWWCAEYKLIESWVFNVVQGIHKTVYLYSIAQWANAENSHLTDSFQENYLKKNNTKA